MNPLTKTLKNSGRNKLEDPIELVLYKRNRRKILRKYNQTDKGKATRLRYSNSVKGKITKCDSHLMQRYGINLATKLALYISQRLSCAICRKHFPLDKLIVEHDHITNLVRGLTCYRCNILIGQAHDSIYLLENAIEYLRDHG